MALNNLGSALLEKDQVDEALELFTESYEIGKESIAALNIGLLHQQHGNIGVAEEWYRAAIESIPTDRSLTSADIIPYYFLADLMEKMGFADEALLLYEEATKHGDKFAEPYINLGIAYQKRAKSKEAVIAFREAIRINPHMPAPHYHLAGILAESGALSGAEDALKTVLRLSPNYENADRHLKNIQEMNARTN